MQYITLLLIVFFITILFKIKNVDYKQNFIYFNIIITLLFLFLGLRGSSVGLDMGNYFEFFKAAKDNSVIHLINNYGGFELGFKLYTKFVTFFTNNYRIYIFVTGLITMIGPYFFIKENSKNYFTSLILYITFEFYILSFCILRQSLAISILLISFNFLKNNKNIKFIFFVLISSLFHKTALIFLIIYFIKKVPYTSKVVRMYLIATILIFLFRLPIMNFLTKLLYEQYIGRELIGEGYFMLLMLYGIPTFILLFFKNFDLKSDNNRLCLYMILIGIPFQILSTVQGVAARIVLYFSYSMIILIPNAMESLPTRSRKLITIIYVVVLTLYYVYNVLNDPVYVSYTIF